MFDKIRKIRKLPELGAGRVRGPIADEIPLTKQVPTGPEEDELEKAAVPPGIGTLPERIVWKWLLDHDYQFEYQQAEMGGRDVMGGAVIDFILYGFAVKPMVIRVQGQYWHGPQFPQRQRRDDEQYYRLHAMGYAVCDLWEQDIYQAVYDKRLDAYMEEELYASL